MNSIFIVLLLAFIEGASGTVKQVRVLKNSPPAGPHFAYHAYGEITSRLSPGLRNYRITFPNHSVISWPRQMTIYLPVATNDGVIASFNRRDKKSVIYHFTYLENTLEKSIGKAVLVTFKTPLYTLPLTAVYSPDGSSQYLFLLENQTVTLKEIDILSSDSQNIYITQQINNIVLSHQSYLIPQQTINLQDIKYE